MHSAALCPEHRHHCSGLFGLICVECREVVSLDEPAWTHTFGPDGFVLQTAASCVRETFTYVFRGQFFPPLTEIHENLKRN